MAVFKNVIVVAPVSEVSCPLPEIPPSIRSPSYRFLPPTYGASQTLCERTKWKGKFRRNKLSKDHIGSPSNARHLCHIGWNPQTGFATNLDPELKMIFAQAGVTQDQMKDKRTSKKIFEAIDKQGGREAVLKETKGLWTKFHDHSGTSSELVPGCPSKNELDCRTLSTKDGFEDGLAVPASISTLHGTLHRERPWAPPVSPSKRTSQRNVIPNMKEPPLTKAKSDHFIPLSPDILMCQIKKGTQLKPVGRSWDKHQELTLLHGLELPSKFNSSGLTCSTTMSHLTLRMRQIYGGKVIHRLKVMIPECSPWVLAVAHLNTGDSEFNISTASQ